MVTAAPAAGLRSHRPSPPPAQPASPASPAPEADWTILLYQAGDNNLRTDLKKNLVECQQVGSSSSLNIVSQFDQGAKGGGCNRYYVTKSGGNKITSPVVQKMGDVDMADPQQLADFVEWGMKQYPARHTMLVISDHGDAWKGAVEDDGANTFMSLPQIQQGLDLARQATGQKLDVLGFDACLMANAEVADQLKDDASYLVGSEETEGDGGWPYNRILSADQLRSMQHATESRGDTSPEAFVRRIVTDARGDQGDLPTLSALDLSKVPDMTAAVKSLTAAVDASGAAPADVRAVAEKAQKFDDTRDLYDFADRMGQQFSDASVQAAAEQVKQSISNMVVAEQHSSDYPNAHGVSIDLSARRPSQEYDSLDLPEETGWNSMLASWQGQGRR